MKKEQIISELRRVAGKLQSRGLTVSQFKRHAQFSVHKVRNAFGSWNEAVEAAGLCPNPPGHSPEFHPPRISDEELLLEIIRLTRKLAKRPTESAMNAKGRFSSKPYYKRWGSFKKACEEAYARYGYPQAENDQPSHSEQAPEREPRPPAIVTAPMVRRPKHGASRRKVQFGEPIDFRGLRFAPINEQGVVYLFGMISRELGFLIESIRTEYPDCEGKRCINPNKQRWEHVLIEFEYQSSNFRDHGHSPDDCDLIVCWIHDWEDCPIDVLELRSQIGYLPNR